MANRAPMKKRILFVDDDPSILNILQHMLQTKLADWDITFALTGQEALRRMETGPFDAVVSDLRMPGMDGTELLNKVKQQYPRTIRLVFSSEADPEVSYRLVGSTHQFLLKPYDLMAIRETIERAFALRDLLTRESLGNVVTQIRNLPSLPDLYLRVVQELQSPSPSIDRVGDIIRRDIAMSAKILQLVNSAFFGLRQHVADPTQAAALLGVETLKSLVLVVHIFTQPAQVAIAGFSYKRLWDHSLTVGIYSQEIALLEGIDKKSAETAFIAGLFHDLGKLVMVANMPDAYAQVLAAVREKRIALIDAEKDMLGATHAEVGAYLLGLWGFADAVVEACAYHHHPSQGRQHSFGPLTTVHVANVLEYETQPEEPGGVHLKVDLDYLKQLKLDGRLPAWRSGSRQR